MLEPEDRYFESARLRIHYCVWGDESNPAVILVHGNRDHAHPRAVPHAFLPQA